MASTYDKRDASGGEVHATKRALDPLPPFAADQRSMISHEVRRVPHVPEMGVPHYSSAIEFKCQPFEAGEVLYDACRNTLRSTAGHDMRSWPPAASGAPFPTVAQPQMLPPVSRSQHAQVNFPRTDTHRYSAQPANESGKIVRIEAVDKLDERIGIQPRHKMSDEVQLVMSHAWIQKQGKKPDLPSKIRRITQQFMVANQFVGDRVHMSRDKRDMLWKSLLLRLDMNYYVYAESEYRYARLRHATTKVHMFIVAESKEWREKGIYIHNPSHSTPIFHICTQSWVSPDWDGQLSMTSRAHGCSRVDLIFDAIKTLDSRELGLLQDRIRNLTKISGIPQASSHFAEKLRPDTCHHRQASLYPEDRSSHHVAVSKVESALTPLRNGAPCEERYIPGSTLIGGQPVYAASMAEKAANLPTPERTSSFKRDRNDDPKLCSSKRQRTVSPKPETPDTSEPRKQDFAIAIESIHHSHNLLAKTGPTTAVGLAGLQQIWATQKHESSLAEALQVAKHYATAFGRYCDTALQLLVVLDNGVANLHFDNGGTEMSRVDGRLYSPSHVPFTWSDSIQADDSERDDCRQ